LPKIALSLLTLVAAVAVAIVVYLDAIVGKAIETGCTRALGVEARVGWVRVGLVTGNFSVGRLRIANPPGFEADHFISFDKIHFEIPPDSFRQDTVVVPLLELDGVEVALETVGGKKNYEVILDNLRRFTKSGSADPKAKAPAAGDEVGAKALEIHEGVIRDIVATVDLGKVPGHADRMVVEIPEIRLKANEATGSAQVSVAEVTQVIVTAVLTGIAKKAPTLLAEGLFTGLVGLKDITLALPDSMETGASHVGGAALAIGSGAETTAKKAAEGAKGAFKSLGALFGGGDDEEAD